MVASLLSFLYLFSPIHMGGLQGSVWPFLCDYTITSKLNSARAWMQQLGHPHGLCEGFALVSIVNFECSYSVSEAEIVSWCGCDLRARDQAPTWCSLFTDAVWALVKLQNWPFQTPPTTEFSNASRAEQECWSWTGVLSNMLSGATRCSSSCSSLPQPPGRDDVLAL